MTTMRMALPAAAPMRAAFRLPVLACIALVARIVTFGNPIVNVDEEFYYAVGHAMARGALPYVDVWDRKPFGLFLLYLPAGLFDPPAGVWVYQAMAFAAVVATALIVARLADRAGWRHGALAAAALYILMLGLADGQGGQAPVFYNLAMAGAAWLAIAAVDAGTVGRRRAGIGAMALVGLALQIKYTVVFEGVAFGLWLLWREWRARSSIAAVAGYGAMLCLVALLPTAIVAAGYRAAGHGEAFVYANFRSILDRRADPVAEGLGNLAIGIALLTPMIVPALLGTASRDPAERRTALALRGWLAAALFGFVIFGSWFNHYTLPVMLPAAVCSAGFFGGPRDRRGIGIAILVLAFVAGQIVLARERATRGSRAEFAAIVAAIGRGAAPLYVYQGSAMLHAMTGRPALTRYLFPTHLMYAREQGAVGVDQAGEIGRIFDARPEIVVMQSREDGEDPGKRAIAEHRIAQGGYRRYALLPLGNKTFALFRRPVLRAAPVRR